MSRRPPGGALRRRRERHREGRAAVLAFAVRPHRPAVQLDEVSDDREAKAEAAVCPHGAGIALAETLEHVRQQRRRDADAGVADRQFGGRAGGAHGDVDAAPATATTSPSETSPIFRRSWPLTIRVTLTGPSTSRTSVRALRSRTRSACSS